MSPLNNGAKRQRQDLLEATPLEEMSPAELRAARKHLNNLWRTIEQRTLWPRIALAAKSDLADAPVFEPWDLRAGRAGRGCSRPRHEKATDLPRSGIEMRQRARLEDFPSPNRRRQEVVVDGG
jgi:hypothetical protein